MKDPQDSQPVIKMNHNLSILALVLAMAGVVFAVYGPWFVAPSVVAGLLARRAIHKEPNYYTGLVFVYASLLLNAVLVLLFLFLYLG
ncbi:MAG: hypothetical protein IBX50_17450 [Marinospirillum sp.]|uniref:hypothetical protein n=1 Tax=Marinospirillum sp. TaxID=2183934 RepID=UPI001A09FA3A|nr:hypothetical protein [Marinospirillum sp.]MBE0508477.1 hypothetical protein [Marinospirillum sp.]